MLSELSKPNKLSDDGGYKIPENITQKIVTSVSWVMIAIVALLIIYGLVPGIIQMF